MVIKVIQMNLVEAARWISAATVISGFIWMVGGFLALAVWNAYRDDIVSTAGLATREDIHALERTIFEASQNFATLSRQIVVLSRPENVVNYRDIPSAAGGSCVAGEVCVISVFAERDQRATECRIIPEKTELLLLSNNREYVASPSSGRTPNNLPSQPRALEPRFTLPVTVPEGNATAIIRTFYTNCLWQVNGQPPVAQDSPPFNIQITSSRNE